MRVLTPEERGRVITMARDTNIAVQTRPERRGSSSATEITSSELAVQESKDTNPFQIWIIIKWKPFWQSYQWCHHQMDRRKQPAGSPGQQSWRRCYSKATCDCWTRTTWGWLCGKWQSTSFRTVVKYLLPTHKVSNKTIWFCRKCPREPSAFESSVWLEKKQITFSVVTKKWNLHLSFFCHFISANISSCLSKKSDTLLPWSSLSAVKYTLCLVSGVKYSQISGMGKTICSIVRSCLTIWGGGGCVPVSSISMYWEQSNY